MEAITGLYTSLPDTTADTRNRYWLADFSPFALGCSRYQRNTQQR